eukprot:TRINITY_DN15476_c0_g1_i1.p1 TRINITY_DN15476_c0_g1~~TRINITY_DN15476_c0_g1_i1.p1  ORF type:complete len:187 (-),score=27.36 TRINITY_DN15476_c0_g1_i1:200-760(-)
MPMMEEPAVVQIPGISELRAVAQVVRQTKSSDDAVATLANLDEPDHSQSPDMLKLSIQFSTAMYLQGQASIFEDDEEDGEMESRLEAAGIPSLGSLCHGTNCKPCEFYFKHRTCEPQKANQTTRPVDCRHGRLCHYCHAEHDAVVWKIRKKKNTRLNGDGNEDVCPVSKASRELQHRFCNRTLRFW